MIDFKEEISKYQPALDVDDLQDDLQLNEVQDLLELMQFITNKNTDKE